MCSFWVSSMVGWVDKPSAFGMLTGGWYLPVVRLRPAHKIMVGFIRTVDSARSSQWRGSEGTLSMNFTTEGSEKKVCGLHL
jgi:hypothetical protein